MNEIAQNPYEITIIPGRFRLKLLGPVNWSFVGYGTLAIALGIGWLVRDKNIVDPNNGIGYWLGIVGGTLMLLLLFYPASKRSALLRRLGLVKHWFRIHMIFGLVGPLLVLYHCNFSVAAINSNVALYSMLAVAGSGIIGHYFYARIHRGLYGKRANIEDLRTELAAAIDGNNGVAVILPKFAAELHDISEELLGAKYTKKMNISTSLIWTFKHYYIRARLFFNIRRELQVKGMLSNSIAANRNDLSRVANQYAKTQVNLMRRVAQLSFYERLFSLWHVFHMPMFILLIVSALVHVLAVHMY